MIAAINAPVLRQTIQRTCKWSTSRNVHIANVELSKYRVGEILGELVVQMLGCEEVISCHKAGMPECRDVEMPVSKVCVMRKCSNVELPEY